MNSKDRRRQRDTLTPQAGAPNWLLVAVAVLVTVAALIARRFV
jgi:hypothetical protein